MRRGHPLPHLTPLDAFGFEPSALLAHRSLSGPHTFGHLPVPMGVSRVRLTDYSGCELSYHAVIAVGAAPYNDGLTRLRFIFLIQENFHGNAFTHRREPTTALRQPDKQTNIQTCTHIAILRPPIGVGVHV